MSQENVELSLRFWAAFNDRDWDAWWGCLDEGIEWHARADEPDADVYHGHEGVGRLLDQWTEMFPDLCLEVAGESIDLGEHVISPTHLVGTARTTRIEVREPYSWLFRIPERTIVLVREFHDNAEALAAVESRA
jgi:ketosteroid isomerase-like protein